MSFVNVHSTEESLRAYGTAAFGVELMQQHVEYHRNGSGLLDAVSWFVLVPDAYRQDVLVVCERVFNEYVGRSSTVDSLNQFVRELNSEIWRCVAVRATGAPGGDAEAIDGGAA